jgi:catechol 2,3-dioxygenase-like lactoylglutathione lyase family enzyme
MQERTIHLGTTVPVVPVTEIAAAVAFYRDQLGFTVAFEAGDYVGVTRDEAMLHLDGVVNNAAGRVTCRIETSGVDGLYAELEPRGVVDPEEPIRNMPWGSRQFSILDCCGNRVTFVQSA